MENYLEYLVSSEDSLARIDRFVTDMDPELSRSTVQKLIAEARLLVNQQPVKPSYKVKVGDDITITEIDYEDAQIIATPMPIDIVYEDEDLVVVNKPSGMVVHPAPGHYQDTLVNGLMYHINQLSDINGENRPGIVHRIDKDTSGLLMVAKNNRAHQKLSEELKAQKTKREYIALVDGVIKNKRGKINAPIGRSKSNRLMMDVVAGGKEAVTHFEVIETFEQASLIKCILETGRTHQIRVHMAYIKHPILGDPIYGLKDDGDFGQYLHAKKLGFKHPRTGIYMEFDSDLPSDFQNKIKQLKNVDR